MSFDGAQAKQSEIEGALAADTSRVTHQHQNRGMGFTKSQYIEVSMKKVGVFNTRYHDDKWFDAAANVRQADG